MLSLLQVVTAFAMLVLAKWMTLVPVTASVTLQPLVDLHVKVSMRNVLD